MGAGLGTTLTSSQVTATCMQVGFKPTGSFKRQLLGSPFSVAQLGENPPTMQETMVRFLGQEDLLEKG